jgi:hypothetical protein
MSSSRLALGTVQFGLPYGVANRAGQVGREEAAAIIEQAAAAGLDTLDTAVAYGESEKRLGEIGVGRWRVVSKLPEMPPAVADAAGWAREATEGSLGRLKIRRLRGLLLHRSSQLLGPRGEELYAALAELKTRGLVEKIGVSIYGPEELEALWPRFRFDLVQAPFNVFDRRLAASGWLEKLHQAGVEVHARSIFLQGLLLMDAAARPARFDRWRPRWERWHQWLKNEGQTPLQACLQFALSRPELDRVVVGVDSLAQFREIVRAADSKSVTAPTEQLMCEDRDLIDPSRWAAA